MVQVELGVHLGGSRLAGDAEAREPRLARGPARAGYHLSEALAHELDLILGISEIPQNLGWDLAIPNFPHRSELHQFSAVGERGEGARHVERSGGDLVSHAAAAQELGVGVRDLESAAHLHRVEARGHPEAEALRGVAERLQSQLFAHPAEVNVAGRLDRLVQIHVAVDAVALEGADPPLAPVDRRGGDEPFSSAASAVTILKQEPGTGGSHGRYPRWWSG